MNKARALKIYEEVAETQGRHNGLWECEYFDCADEYLSFMKNVCDNDLNIDYDPDINSYLLEEEIEELEDYQKKDAMGYELACIIKEKLRDIIFGDD